jgi:hypothetical protein
MNNFYVTRPVSKEIKDETTGKSLGVQRHNEATIQGNVLGLVDNNITDKYERDYIGLNIEIEPGYDRFVQSANPEIQALLLAAKRGDLVRITGVVKGRGSNIRILTYTTLKAAPPALTLVEKPAETTATEAVAA